MVKTYGDKNPAYSEQQVCNINTGYEDDDKIGVGYDNVEPDEMEKGVVATPAFGSIAVVESTNVHFGNKTYYQGPVTVLKQTILSTSEVQKTHESNGLPPKDIANKSSIDKGESSLFIYHHSSPPPSIFDNPRFSGPCNTNENKL